MKLITAAQLQLPVIQAASKKIPKVAVGYVYRPGVDYRCRECWKHIPATQQCAELRPQDTARPNGYCIVWAFGIPRPGLVPTSAYTPEEVGYGEKVNGTKCHRCGNFVTPDRCKRVDENSPGDTPGEINYDACCQAQWPRIDK